VLFVLGTTGALVALLIETTGGAGALVETYRHARLELAAIPLLMIGVNVLLSAVRWRIVLAAMGYRLSLGRALHAVLATWPLAVVLPSRAGDFVRALHIRDVAPPFATAGSVLAEKAVDVQSLCLLSIVGGASTGAWELAGVATGVLLAAWAGAVAVVRIGRNAAALPIVRRFPDKVAQLAAAFESLARDRARFGLTVLASFAAWLNAVGILAVLLWMARLDLPLGAVASLWPLSVMAGMVPVTLGGLGTRDAAFLLLLAATGLQVHEASVLSATLGYALVASWLPALVGIPFMLRTRPSGS
jgi:hypothetical protein